jgi:hypothetical protein
MRKKANWLGRALLLVPLIIASGCQGGVSGSETSGGGDSSSGSDVATSLPPETGYYLYKDGASDYTILLPASPTDNEVFAKDELVSNFAKATGYTLPYMSADDIAYSPDAHYISIGGTSMARSAGIEATRDELTRDGYRILTKGQSVYILGPNDTGTLYGVYGFLETTVGYHFYADDEIKVDQKDEVPLYEFDVSERPAFEQRALSQYYLTDDETYRRRLRVDYHGEGWIYGSHSHFNILPPDTYKEEHPDWYSSDGTQLNLSNEEMQAQFAENLCSIIDAHPDERYILLGEMDYNTFCDCDECTALIEQYGTPSAVDILFVNKMVEKVYEHLAETDPDREIAIGTFAYNKTFDPPAHQDSEGNWVINDPILKLDDRAFIYMAPLHANFNHAFHDAENYALVGKQMDGWKVVAKQAGAWTYSQNFLSYFTPFNNFGSVARQYQEYQEMGCISLVDQGNWDTATPFFNKLMIYVYARLLWDPSLSYEALTDDFMRNYYKDCYEDVRAYYDLERTHAEWLKTEYGIGESCYSNTQNPDYWSRAYLRECMGHLDSALETASSYRESDPGLYEKLYNRVNVLRGTVLYHILCHYQSDYTTTEQSAMIDEFEGICSLNRIIYWHEHTNLSLGEDGSIATFIENCRLSID